MRKEKRMQLNVSRRLLLDTDKTEKQIAKILYISETSLRQLYITTFSLPPRKYIRNVILKRAQTMLRISNKSISDIAYYIGYINVSKFTQSFKNNYGVTPSDYRKSLKNYNTRKNCGLRVEKLCFVTL